MYKIVSVVKTSEDGKKIKFYGIKSNDSFYPDISTNVKKVKLLCRLCNKNKIQNHELKYIIDDFL